MKKIALKALLLFCLLCIAGCSRQKTDAAATLTYWSMWNSTENQAKIIQQAADEYFDETGIKVNIQWKGRDLRNLIGAALEAGESIDMYDGDMNHIIQNNKRYIVNLSEMPFEAEYESHIMPIILNKLKSDKLGQGSLYALPYQPFVIGVWYNKAMFQNAGITAPPKTWDEFLAVCQKLRDFGVNPLTCNADTANLIYGTQLLRYLSQDTVLEMVEKSSWAEVPEALLAARNIYDLSQRGYFSPYAPANYPDGQNEIGFGESCMILNASWIPNEINQTTGAQIDWGFFPWPSIPGRIDASDAAAVGSQAIAIIQNSSLKQEAVNFALKIVTGKYDLLMAQSVQSIPADMANTQWPASISDARPYVEQMKVEHEWAGGLESRQDATPLIQAYVVQLIKREITPEQLISLLASIG